MDSARVDRPYDLTLFGASGFAGGLTGSYLAGAAPAGLRLALAGRDRGRLEALADRLAGEGAGMPRPGVLVADAADGAALRAMADASRVVIDTVGPYALRGERLIAACVAAGTDYVDITGEEEFVDRVWLDHHAEARRRGVRLVHCGGFHSVPHDLGAWFTVRRLPEGVPLRVEGYVSMRLRLSGGSYRSAIHGLARSRQRLAVAAARREREPRPAGREVRTAPGRIHRSDRLGGWVAPLPSISGTVVRRSAAALDRYGPCFSFGYNVVLRRLVEVGALAAAVGAARVMSHVGPTRRLLLGAKAPGRGPDAAARGRGWFRIVFVGEGGGERVVTETHGGDPGYTETAKMLGEAGLCLAFDELPPRFGQLTPTVAMGDALIARLERRGIPFHHLTDSPGSAVG